MNTVLALSGVVIKELYRRKDFYVLFIFTAIITLTMGSVSFFGDPKIALYLKEVTLMLIWIAALVIAIGTTARQIPAERENRTIFPLLAKPVTRAQVIVGKFLGCWLACGISLLVFYAFFAVVSGSREGQWHVGQYVQALCLHWFLIGIVVSMVLFGSVVSSAVSANATISFVVCGGIMFLGEHLNKVASRMAEPSRTLVSVIYFLIPHLEWFDIRKRVTFNWPLVPWDDCLLACLYAVAYMALFLFATWLVFRRKPLNQ